MDTHINTLLSELQTSGIAYLQVKVIPKSPKTELVEVMADETFKIRLKAVPEKGKANMELIRFFSKLLKVPKTSVTIVSGATDRNKLVKIIS